MTTSTLVPEASAQQNPPKTWGDIAVGFAGKLASPEFRPGDVADLRRMHPDTHDAPAFWRLMAEHENRFRGDAAERKWGLILHGIALMTPEE